MTTISHKNMAPLLLMLAFVEGGVVIGVQLMGAKMFTPFYGSALFIWTSIIGVTLMALTAGYFIGGRLSQHPDPGKILFLLFQGSALWIVLMPMIALPVLNGTSLLIDGVGSIGMHLAAVLSAFVLQGIPLILLGATTPMIIKLLASKIDVSGKISGKVYAVSTVGGILAAFTGGFYIIPAFGVTWPVMVMGAALALTAYGVFFRYHPYLAANILLMAGAIALVGANRSSAGSENGTSLRYQSEGILGQLKVTDVYQKEVSEYLKHKVYIRTLLLNGINQTQIIYTPTNPMLLKKNTSTFGYIHRIGTLSSLMPAGADVLLLGLGGGTMAKEFTQLGFSIDAVDIDERTYDLSNRYFNFDPQSTRFYVDDARHFIRTVGKTYDGIVFDLAAAEVQPSNLFTLQGFREVKQLLRENGMILITFQGYIDPGETSLPVRSILKTLQSVGFQVYYSFNEKTTPGRLVDIQIIASMDHPPFHRLDLNRLNTCCSERKDIQEMVLNPVQDANFNLSTAHILVDDKPSLDMLNAQGIIAWRKYMLDTYTKTDLEQGLELFE